MANTRITLAMVMDHMQHMQQLLVGKIDGLVKGGNVLEGRVGGLVKRLDDLQNTLTLRMDRLERRMDWQDVALTNIDKRLDSIELEFLPKRVRKLEKKVFAGARA